MVTKGIADTGIMPTPFQRKRLALYEMARLPFTIGDATSASAGFRWSASARIFFLHVEGNCRCRALIQLDPGRGGRRHGARIGACEIPPHGDHDHHRELGLCAMAKAAVVRSAGGPEGVPYCRNRDGRGVDPGPGAKVHPTQRRPIHRRFPNGPSSARCGWRRRACRGICAGRSGC